MKTEITPETMTIKLVEFCMWVDSELANANGPSHSADFTTRKMAGIKIDELKATEKMLQEFLILKKAK